MTTGWLCPSCHKAHAPSVLTCPGEGGWRFHNNRSVPFGVPHGGYDPSPTVVTVTIDEFRGIPDGGRVVRE